MRGWFLVAAVTLFAGCSHTPPVLQPGDEVRPEVAVAPRSPWSVGARVAIGMLLQVHRPGRKIAYLNDKDVAIERVTMRARVTFLNGDSPVGEPLEVPFVHDC